MLARLEVPSRLSENRADPVITGYEAACLCRGDIPYFCTEFDGCSLCGGETDEIIRPAYFRRSAKEMAVDFLDSLSEADLLFEKGLIREYLSNIPCREDKDTEDIPVGDESATEESILQLCAGLADTVTASRLRTSLAQYRELATFTQFGSDLDDATKKVLASGARMMAALRQDRYAPLEDWKQALLLLAVSAGCADGIDPGEMESFTARLLAWFPASEPELSRRLATGKKLDDETMARVNEALARFTEAL